MCQDITCTWCKSTKMNRDAGCVGGEGGLETFLGPEEEDPELPICVYLDAQNFANVLPSFSPREDLLYPQ